MTNEDKQWVWDLVTWAMLTIVMACKGSGAIVRTACRENLAEFLPWKRNIT